MGIRKFHQDWLRSGRERCTIWEVCVLTDEIPAFDDHLPLVILQVIPFSI